MPLNRWAARSMPQPLSTDTIEITGSPARTAVSISIGLNPKAPSPLSR